jgi:hypothetical protein
MGRVHNALRRVPWKFVLPAVMLTATAAFLRLNTIWMGGAGYWDDMPVTSAWGLVALVNGPGFWLGQILRGPMGDYVGLALASVIFWTWSGYLVDRRLSGNRASMIRKTWIRVALYSLGLVTGCLATVGAIVSPHFVFALTHYHQYVGSLVNTFRTKSPWMTLLGRDILVIAWMLWGLGYAGYFGKKLLLLALGRTNISDAQKPPLHS